VCFPGTGKSHLAQALGQAAIQQGHRVLYREAHLLLEELTDATLDGTRKEVFTELSTVPLLIIDDLGCAFSKFWHGFSLNSVTPEPVGPP
jgi:DNA replication protein DnaC